MRKKDKLPEIVFVLVFIFAIISLYPLIWVILQSLKTEQEFLTSIWSLPSKLQISNYIVAFTKGKLLAYFKNTVINVGATVIVELLLILLAGFAFSKMKMKGKKILFYMVLINMLIPTPIILLPMYLQIINLDIQNSTLAIVFPYFQGFAPMGLILITNYLDNLPNDIIEAARIDGCNTPRILISIIVPLVKPILVTLALLGGMSAWNEYLWALVSISDSSKYPLSVGIAILRDQISVYGYTPVFAALSISAMVFVVLYLCAQKTFVRSITEGAVKG